MRAAPFLAAALVTAPAAARADAPAFRAAVAVPITWRTSTVTPEIGGGIAYHSDAPSIGGELTVAVAPLRWVGPRWLSAVEVEVAASHRPSSASVAGGPGLAAREQRATAELRMAIPVGETFSIAPRAGWSFYRFAVDRDPVPASVRHGPSFGIDAAQRLGAALVADAFARVLPWSGPGPDERAAFGASGGGWGFQVGAGLGGALVGPLGWHVGYDFLRFADTYSGAGSRGVGGSGEARHHALSLGVTLQL